MKDLRETATTQELVDEVLDRIERGVRCVRSAAIIDGDVTNTRGVAAEQVESWRSTVQGQTFTDDDCDPKDKLFPIRLPLIPSSDKEDPIGFIVVGPRPDGSIPSKEEQRALSSVSETIARGVRNVMKREAREQEVLDMISAMGRRIEEVETLLTGGAKRRPRTA